MTDLEGVEPTPTGRAGARSTAGVGLVLTSSAMLAMAWVPGAASTPWPLMWLWVFAVLGYVVAGRGIGRLSPRAIWGGAIAVRLGLLGAAPVLSEDIYRYVWDGWVARNGLNPFAFPPAATELAGLRTTWWELINHPTVPTIYPPGAQMVFAVIASLLPAWLAFKVAWIAADLLTAWLIARLAVRRDAGVMPVFLWLWNPLVLAEVGWNGHFETLGIAAMLGAVLLVHRSGWIAGVFLGIGGAIKFAPLAAVPALLRARGPLAAGLALLVPALLYIPYASAGSRLFEGLGTYADIWAFNAGLFRVLEWTPGPDDIGKWVVAAIVVGIALGAARARWSLERTLYWTIGAGLLLSPTIHPWYALWALAFACLRGGIPWLVFSGTVFLAYAGRDAYLATGAWPEPLWLRLVIHVPLVVLLARDGIRLYQTRAERLG